MYRSPSPSCGDGASAHVTGHMVANAVTSGIVHLEGTGDHQCPLAILSRCTAVTMGSPMYSDLPWSSYPHSFDSDVTTHFGYVQASARLEEDAERLFSPSDMAVTVHSMIRDCNTLPNASHASASTPEHSALPRATEASRATLLSESFLLDQYLEVGFQIA